MAEHTQERTERATPRRRQEARRKGQVAKSSDLSSAVPIVALALLLPTVGGTLIAGLFETMRSGLDASNATGTIEGVTRHAMKTTLPVLAGIGLIITTVFLFGIAANFAQVGIHPTLEAIAPKFDKLNPLNGFKRLFSRRGLFETIKSIAKLALVAGIAYRETAINWDEMMALSTVPVSQGLAWTGKFTASLILKVAFAWLVLAAVDYAWQRRMHERDLMMSFEEVKREMREMETSPELRAEMHRRRQRLAKSRMMSNVKHSDAVITNPLEYAVAIKYDIKKGRAPVVLAKGRHLVADRIREEAKKNKVPIIPNPPLARSLFEQVEVGDQIPQALFQAVAEVLAFVFRKTGKRL
ncbi:MAG: EscU/YscU/HrcU family type III secretion system export apparatus switch protein [Fimbriimonadales bacterium]